MTSEEFWSHLTLFSPLLFMAVLTFGKTKIYWYLATMLPLFVLVYPYLYLKIKNKYARIIIVVLIIGYFIINFIPNTYLLKNDYQIPEKVKLAQCLSKNPNKSLAFLVDEEERKIKNFLEAAHYQTGSSFFYGGSPSFVFYVKKKIDFFYNIDDLSNRILKYSLIVISKKDWQNNNQLKEALSQGYYQLCRSDQWLSFVK